MRKKSPNKKPSPDGFIRIISGQFRGRKLPVKDVQGLRPTTDRVKETLFNWLMQDTRDAYVLDCFAGSGGLGFEALSRFAAHTDFIEKETSVSKQLQLNIDMLKLNNAQVITGDGVHLLEQPNPSNASVYNLVFVDPPFRQGLIAPCCQALEKNNWLSQDALIYVEFEKELNFCAPETWWLIKEKQAGQVLCQLYQRQL